jgi:tetratricopeptide (TPR) repeat protein
MAEISLQDYYEQVEDMIDQGRYAQAVAHGKHILETYPKCVAGYRLLGRAMLEARRDDDALDMFLRVLSADPEDMLSWVALSEIYDRRDELEASIWCLERAFELSVDNQLVGEELRQLYGRRDGVEPERVELTRGALARLYLKGDLLSRSVSEFRTLLDEQPDRVDLEVAFAQALWRNEQRLEASEVCQRILDKLPYCLKANLLLGEIWVNSGREEGQAYLRRAEALDPQNAMAQTLFGDASPLRAQDVRIAPLEYIPSAGEERPAWMVEAEAATFEGPPLTEGEAALVDIAAALEAQIEIPSWLEEIDVGEAVENPEVPAFMASAEEPLEAEEPTFAPEEEAPEWLMGAGKDLEFPQDVEQEPGAELAIGEEDIVSEQVPDWLAGLGAEPIGGEEESPGEGQVPDFLSELGAGTFAEEATPPEEEVPDWLAGLREQAAEDVQAPPPARPAPAEIPDWMQELAPPEAEEPAPPAEEAILGEVEGFALGSEEPPPPAEEAAPPWLEGEGMPSGEEALAWLEQLASGKEEELQAQVEVEIEARTAEIMGRPKAEEPVKEESAPVAEEPPEPAPAEIPDWMQELAPSEAEEPVPSAVGEPTPPTEEATPSWLEGGEMPSGEEALAWLEQLASGKEEELQAQVEAEIEARTAEIMGRPKAEEPVKEEPAPVAEEQLEPAPAEIPDWMQELAPPEAEEPAPSEVEGAFGWTAFGEPEVSAAEEFAPAEIEEPVFGAVEEPTPSEIEEPVLSEVEGAFGWTAFGEPEAFAPSADRVSEVEQAAEMEEAMSEAAPVSPVEEPPAGEVEEVMAEAVAAPLVEELVPDEVEEIVAPSAEKPEVPPAAVIEPKVRAAPPAAAAPPKPKPRPPVAEPADPFAVEKAYLKENPRDYDARLNLARALWQAGRRREALEAYGRLVRAGKELEMVTTELEEYLEQWPDVSTQRVLGDAYMKSNQLDKALALYRRALENL